MDSSPLQFAKEFARLKTHLADQPAGDARLLLLVEFWASIRQYEASTAYRSYFDEYIPLLLQHINEENLYDLRPVELEGLLGVLCELSRSDAGFAHKIEIQDHLGVTTTELARKLFYAGAVEDGLRVIGGLERDAAPPREIPDGLNEFDAFKLVCKNLAEGKDGLPLVLQAILDSWEGEREAISHEEANCLFVERDSRDRMGLGRLCVLRGSAEQRRRTATTDEVTFENQIKAPDDPFVGVVYDSLDAVRSVLKQTGFSGKAGSRIRARFSIRGSDHTFTGDSIGLAAGLVTFTQLLKPEVLKQERFVAAEAAFTGAVDAAGRVLPVNEESLRLKIERAFFSPIKYLVLPESNVEVAKRYVDDLRKSYPRRQLRLSGVETLRDVIENRNIVRSEKVCVVEFVVRKAYKYSRATKVQVPLLVVLLAVACLLYADLFPKHMPWFDWNPEYVKLTKTGFVALNADSIPLWSVEYECESLEHQSQWKIGDLDGDAENEVAFVPKAVKSSPCESNANLFVYDEDGKQLFQRDCTIHSEYPSDTSIQLPYSPRPIGFVESGDSTIIVTVVIASYPSRTHIKFWSASGDPLGWYINAGTAGADDRHFSSAAHVGFMYLGINSRVGSASLFVLPRDSSFGVSPPYADPEYDLENVKRGNQLCYVLFPPSDVNSCLHYPYNGPFALVVESDAVIRANINQAYEEGQPNIEYLLDMERNFRVFDVKLSDRFKQVRGRLVQEGKLTEVDWSTYTDNLRDVITYWSDSGWVTEGQLRALESQP